MSQIQFSDQDNELTRNQRLGHYFTLLFAAFALFAGFNLRNSLLFETVAYFDPEAGVRVNYPAGWLIDTGQSEYIFRAQDTSRIGFKTTLQISTLPFNTQMTARNVLDDLSLTRSTRLASYNVLSIPQGYRLPDGEAATLMEYAFVFRERNPFQESLPVVVIGRDILVIRRGQVILITFLANAQTYQTDLDIFQRFLVSLDF